MCPHSAGVPVRALAVLLAAALPACSRAPKTDTRAVPARTVTMTGDVQARYTVESSIVSHTIEASPDLVWVALPAVYEELGVPLSVYDVENRRIGNENFQPSRLGGARLSRYLDCGSAAVTGRPYADQYRVTLNLVTRVDAGGPEQAVINTEIDASAMPVDMSGYRVQCRTRGSLERQIKEMVEERVSGGSTPDL